MNKDQSPYQRVHETMSTIAKGVGKNTKDITANDESIKELWEAHRNVLHTFAKLNGVLDSNTELHKLHTQRMDRHQEQIKELQQDIKHTKRVLLVYVWFIALINLGFLLYGLFQ